MGVFSLLCKLGLDATSFETGVKKAQSLMSRFGADALGSVKGQLAAAFSVGAVAAFAHSVVEAADRVGDLAAQMNLSNEEVQKLDIAASRVGVPIESLGNMLAKVGEYRKKAGEGDQEAADNLQRMGVSAADIQNSSLKNLDIVDKMTRSYEKGNRTAKDQADFLEVAGLKANKVLAVFEELHRMGPVKMFSDEDIEAISRFKDATEDIKRNMMVAAAPSVSWWADAMNRRNKMEQDPNTKWYHLTTLASLAVGMMDDQDGTKTAGMPIEEVRAEAARRKAQRAETANDLFAEKFTTPTKAGNGPSFAGGSLRSVGGILFDRFDDGNMAREAMRLSQRTAAATEKTASALDKAANR